MRSGTKARRRVPKSGVVFGPRTSGLMSTAQSAAIRIKETCLVVPAHVQTDVADESIFDSYS